MPIVKEKNITVSTEKLTKIIGLIKERANFIADFWEQSYFFFVTPTSYEEKAVQKRWKENTPVQMTELMQVLEGIDDFSSSNQEVVVIKWIEEKGYGMGAVMNAFRLALVGAAKGPHLFDITEIIGKEETIARLRRAVVMLNKKEE